jgi:hypothetical protein
LGHDYRFQGDQVVGSGLVFEESVIHLAFFRFDRRERFDDRTGYLERRDLMRG